MARRAFAALLAMLVALSAIARDPDPAEAIVLAVKVNQVPRGDAVVIPVEGSTDLWVRAREAARFGLTLPPPGEVAERSGDFVKLRASPRLALVVDLDKLELAIEAAPELLARQNFSLSSQPQLSPRAQSSPNGFISYGLGRQTFTGSEATVSGDLLANVAIRDWVLRSDWTYVSRGRDEPVQRGSSYVLHDDVEGMLRWTVGDVQPAGAYAGRSPAMAGVAVERLFAVSPGFIANPTASFSGSVRTPTVAEIYVDGARVRTIALAPGTYEFRDLSYFSGLRNVEIVLRDRAGNTESLRLPVYFTGENLRAGLHEFRYAAGSPRDSFEGNGSYAGRAISGRHRYGVTDDLTVGASVEVIPGYRSAGVGAIVRVSTLGIVAANAVYSDSERGLQGHSAIVAYSYGGQRASFSATAFRQSRDFGAAPGDGISLAPGRPRERFSAGFGMGIGPQRNITIDGSRGRTWDGPSDSFVSARITQGFANGASLNLTLARRDDGATRGNDVTFAVSLPLWTGVSFNAATEQRAGRGSRQTISASSSVPAGEGIGWRVDGERESGLVGSDAFVQGNHRYASLSAAVRRVEARGLEPVTGTDVRLAGSVVGIGGRAFLARPVAQSFALAEVPGVAGVRIYHNSQLVGRTDGEGQLLVPALGGYGVNQLSLDDRDVPIDRELKQVRQEVVPRDFVGTRASFETKRVSALGGILVASIGGQPLPVASAELVLRGGKGDAAGISGPDGDFYFDDLEPGRYEIEALNRKVRCRASVTLAEGRGPFVDLGRVSCSAIAQ